MFQKNPSEQAEQTIKAVYPPVSDVIYICCVPLFNAAAKVCDRARFTDCVIDSPTWFFPAADVHVGAP